MGTFGTLGLPGAADPRKPKEPPHKSARAAGAAADRRLVEYLRASLPDRIATAEARLRILALAAVAQDQNRVGTASGPDQIPETAG